MPKAFTYKRPRSTQNTENLHKNDPAIKPIQKSGSFSLTSSVDDDFFLNAIDIENEYMAKMNQENGQSDQITEEEVGNTSIQINNVNNQPNQPVIPLSKKESITNHQNPHFSKRSFDTENPTSTKKITEHPGGGESAGGFATAGGKAVVMSEEGKKKANSFMQSLELDLLEEGQEDIQDEINDPKSMGKEPTVNKSPGIGGFSTAGGKTVTMSEQGKQKAQSFLKSIELELEEGIEPFPDDFANPPTFGNKTSNRFENSKNINEQVKNRRTNKQQATAGRGNTGSVTYPKVQSKDAQNKNHLPHKGNLEPGKGGFATAGGKAVVMSEEGKKKATSFMQSLELDLLEPLDDFEMSEFKVPSPNLNTQGGQAAFTTAGGRVVTMSEEGKNKANSFMESLELDLQDFDDRDADMANLKNAGPSSASGLKKASGGSGGFATAGGKAVVMSEEGKKKAQSFMQSLELDLVEEQETSSNKLLQNEKKNVEVKKATASKATGGKPIVPTAPTKGRTEGFATGGFATAGGKAVVMSEEGKKKANSFLKSIEEDIASVFQKNNKTTDEEAEDEFSAAVGFSTARGGEVTMSEQAKRKGQSFLKSLEEDLSMDNGDMYAAAEIELPDPKTATSQHRVSDNAGFSTAAGKTVTMSEEGKKKAQSFLNSLQDDLLDQPEIENFPTPETFQPRNQKASMAPSHVKAPTPVNLKAKPTLPDGNKKKSAFLASLEEDLADDSFGLDSAPVPAAFSTAGVPSASNPPARAAGFATAGGKAVTMSEQAKKKANSFMQSLELDLQDPSDELPAFKSSKITNPVPVQGGFATAGGKAVTMSEEGKKKATSFMQSLELDLQEQESDISEMAEFKKAAPPASSVKKGSSAGGFATAGGKAVVMSEEGKKKANSFMQSLELDLQEADSEFSTFQPAEGKGKFGKASKLDEMECEDADSLKKPASFIAPGGKGGFSTAAGKAVTMSEEGKKKANSFMQSLELDLQDMDDQDSDMPDFKKAAPTPAPGLQKASGGSGGFATAGGKAVLMSEEGKKKAQSFMQSLELDQLEEQDDFLEFKKPQVPVVGDNKQTSEGGFATAGGKSVIMSEEGKKKANSFMQSLELDLQDMGDQDSAMADFKKAATPPDFKRAAAPPALKTPQGGFATAGGRTVTMSEEGKKKANSFMQSLELDLQDMGDQDLDMADFKKAATPPASSLKKASEGSGGFATAGGRSVTMSEEGKKKANSFMQSLELDLQDMGDQDLDMADFKKAAPTNNASGGNKGAIGRGTGGFATAGGRSVAMSEEGKKKAQSFLKELEADLMEPLQDCPEEEDQTFQSPTKQGAFSTAKGKEPPSSITGEARKKAQSFMEALEMELLDTPTPESNPQTLITQRDSKPPTSGFQIAKGKQGKATETAKKAPIVQSSNVNNSIKAEPVNNFVSPKKLSPGGPASNANVKQMTSMLLGSQTMKRSRPPTWQEEEQPPPMKMPSPNNHPTEKQLEESPKILSAPIGKKLMRPTPKPKPKFTAPRRSTPPVNPAVPVKVEQTSPNANSKSASGSSSQNNKASQSKAPPPAKKGKKPSVSLFDFDAHLERVPIGQLALPRLKTRNELISEGVTEKILDCSVDAAKNLNDFQFTNFTSFEDIRKQLIADGAHDTLSLDWVENHCQLIIWKLASMERSYPNHFANRYLTGTRLLSQLKYRYEREFNRLSSSAIKKILEKDAFAHRKMHLLVTKVICYSSDPFLLFDENNQPVPFTPAEIQLSDGWYFITCVLDRELSVQLLKSRIVVGMKLTICGAKLDDGNPTTPLENINTKLLIQANGTRRCHWAKKLGFSKRFTFSRNILSIKAGGGVIPALDVIIYRIYPLLYMQTIFSMQEDPKSGKSDLLPVYSTIRNQRDEDAENKKFARLFEVETSKKRAELMAEMQNPNTAAKKGPRLKLSKNYVRRLQDGDALYEAYKKLADGSDLFPFLDPNQTSMLNRAIEKYKMEEFHEMEDELKSFIEGSPELNRKVKILFKFQVMDCPAFESRCLGKANITVWNGTPELASFLKEGQRIRVYFLEPSKFQTENTPVQLSTTSLNFTPLPPIHFPHSLYKPRTVTHISLLTSMELNEEFDCYGVLVFAGEVKTTYGPPPGNKPTTQQHLFFTDDSGNLLVVYLKNSTFPLPYSAEANPFPVYSMMNIFYERRDPRYGFDVANANECSIFKLQEKSHPLHKLDLTALQKLKTKAKALHSGEYCADLISAEEDELLLELADEMETAVKNS